MSGNSRLITCQLLIIHVYSLSSLLSDFEEVLDFLYQQRIISGLSPLGCIQRYTKFIGLKRDKPISREGDGLIKLNVIILVTSQLW